MKVLNGEIMTLDKAIEHKKEKRKPYRGANAVDRTCCNHGSDDWSKSDRLYKNIKRLKSMDDRIEDYE